MEELPELAGPATERRLSEDDKATFQRWLQSRVPASTAIHCSVCGEQNWEILPHVIEARPYANQHLMWIASSYPLVGLTCTNCSNTLFFSALKVGLTL